MSRAGCLSFIVRQDMLAESIFDQVSPTIDRLSSAVARQHLLSIASSGIVDDGPMIGVCGLRCERSPKLDDPALCFSVVITAIEEGKPARACASVGWSVGWMRNRQSGFLASEVMPVRALLLKDRLPDSFTREFSRLEDRFIRALRRGRPPGLLLSWWRWLTEGIKKPSHYNLD